MASARSRRAKLAAPNCCPSLLLAPILSVIILTRASLSAAAAAAAAPAVIVFGDSIVDPGNNNKLVTPAKANFPPYGRDFKGRAPTGRFSNGRIPPDIIATMLGIKELVPAYLDPNLTDQDLLTGVSFASGAAGYDNLTAVLPQVFSLWDQLEMYKDYRSRLEGAAGAARAASIIESSIHVVFSGSNDVLVTYFFFSLRAKTYDLPSYLQYLVNAADSFVKELYALGARRIALLGLPPLGCVPAARTVSGGKERDCVEIYNQASIEFNAQLSEKLEQLNRSLPSSKIAYLDIYTALFHLIQHASDYGFEEATKGCCGTGEIEASVLCNEFTPFTCPETETSKYLFWDGFHPTERAYEIIISQLLPQFLPLV